MGADLSVDVRLTWGEAHPRLVLASNAGCVAVVGPSGSGKTTFLRVLAGVERRIVGSVRALGQVWAAPGVYVPAWTRRVGWVPQDALLFPHLSVRENLGYGGAADATDVAALAEVAAWLGVTSLLDRAPRNLSGGERQRVALGRAILSRPRLLLLDEPFASLDRVLARRLADELAERCRGGGVPVVLVTHDDRDLAAFDAEVWEFCEAGALRRA